MGRPAQPEEIAPTYVFLASNADSSYITGEVITTPLRDDRDPLRVRHSYAEMAMARMLMIAAGFVIVVFGARQDWTTSALEQ